MKGNAKLVQTLNALLATSDRDQPVHGAFGHVRELGYSKLHDDFQKRAIDEMKHAEKLIGRILFFEAVPLFQTCLPCT